MILSGRLVSPRARSKPAAKLKGLCERFWAADKTVHQPCLRRTQWPARRQGAAEISESPDAASMPEIGRNAHWIAHDAAIRFLPRESRWENSGEPDVS